MHSSSIVKLIQGGNSLLYVRKPEKIMAVVFIILLSGLVLFPVAYMIQNSFVFDETGPRYVRGAVIGEWTLFNWIRVVHSNISNSIFYKPALNSLSISIGMTVIALTFGSLFAWLVVRADLPWKPFFSTVLILPYIVPSWTIALAWLTVFRSEKYGGTPGIWLAMTGHNPPDWLAFGYLPIVISLGVHYIPYTFIILRGALANIDSRLEESAELLKAGKLRILAKITLPLVLPSLGSAFVLTFSKGLGEFATQAFLGLPVRFYTFSTRIYSSLSNQMYAEGYVLAMILITTTSTIVFFNQMMLGKRKRYVTISGKGSRRKAVELRKWKWPMLAVLLTFVVIFVFGPLLLLGWQTLMRYDGQYNLSNLTLHYWIGKANTNLADGQPGIFRNPSILNAIGNSLKMAGTTSIISGFIGILIGYTVVKGRGKLYSRVIESITFMPYLIPGIAFGGIYLTIFAKSWGPIPSLYGTFALLIIVCVIKYLPYSSSAGIAAMHQIDPSLEEVAVVHNIGWIARFRKIVFPLAKSGILSAMLLTFITTMRVLDLVILLVTPKTTLMTSIIFRYRAQDFTQHASGVTLLIVLIVLIGHFILKKLGGKVEL